MASSAVASQAKRPTRTIRPKTKNNQKANENEKANEKEKKENENEKDKTVIEVDTTTTTEMPQLLTMSDEQEEKPYCDPELFIQCKIRRRVSVPFYRIMNSGSMAHLLRSELAKMVEGRCSIEGYICPNSVAISSYSCGTLAAANVHFDIVADCMICYPDENTVIKCIAKTITHAGIRAGARYLEKGKVSPIEVFLSRDMHASSRDLFSRIEENDILTVKIIGRRFVLHDTHVTIIALLLEAENP